jgi:UDP-glucose 4-epimerase
MFNDKTLLITGGTGSFGNAVLNRLIDANVGEIRIFSRDEKKQDDMRNFLNHKNLRFYIGDVRDENSVRQAMKGVDYVFHAAALKQVPSCEFYPMEALRTNVIGTENVLNAASQAGVKRMIVLSTDKAVYPINAMGISKAMAEKIMVAKSRLQKNGETIYCATRYGNVMASRGSVIPMFISQIKEGRAVTITDPNMTRFLMSLEDSVDLVFHAFRSANQGDIFIQKSPASTLAVLAQALIEIFHGNKQEIQIIGTRHGEKLYESLVSKEEMAHAIETEHYYQIPADNRDLNYSKYFSEGEVDISSLDDYTSHNTRRLTVSEVRELLLSLDYVRGQIRG